MNQQFSGHLYHSNSILIISKWGFVCDLYTREIRKTYVWCVPATKLDKFDMYEYDSFHKCGVNCQKFSMYYYSIFSLSYYINWLNWMHLNFYVWGINFFMTYSYFFLHAIIKSIFKTINPIKEKKNSVSTKFLYFSWIPLFLNAILCKYFI